MNNVYDTIIIGAGNGGLIAACKLAQERKKVLLVEKNNQPGGLSTSIVKGRFEFDLSPYIINEYGSDFKYGKVYDLFKELGIDIDFQILEEAYKIVLENNENSKEYVLPFGIDNFINKIEQYVSGSKNSVKTFFDLAKECSEALDYVEIKKDNADINILKDKYPNFIRLANNSLKSVLNDLEMPLKAQEIITSYWMYLGAPSKMIDFIYFGTSLYKYILLGGIIPKNKSYEISVTLEERIRQLGGVIKYNTMVDNIIIENNIVKGIKCSNGDSYLCNNVICNLNPYYVYNNLINNPPKKALQLNNQRDLGGRCFTVYLGLNKDVEELGLTNFMTFIYDSLDSDNTFKAMQTLDNDNQIVLSFNNLIPDYSPKGTSIVCLQTTYYSDCFNRELEEIDYFALREQIALKLIKTCEKKLKIDLINSIEEIEILTPVTYSSLFNSPQGCINGYQIKKDDMMLDRIISSDTENFIQGLRFCGSSGSKLSKSDSTYLSGIEISKEIILKGVDM